MAKMFENEIVRAIRKKPSGMTLLELQREINPHYLMVTDFKLDLLALIDEGRVSTARDRGFTLYKLNW